MDRKTVAIIGGLIAAIALSAALWWAPSFPAPQALSAGWLEPAFTVLFKCGVFLVYWTDVLLYGCCGILLPAPFYWAAAFAVLSMIYVVLVLGAIAAAGIAVCWGFVKPLVMR